MLERVRIDPPLGARLPLETVFRDHRGELTTLGTELRHRPAIVCLVYFECPMLCRLAADGLVRSLTKVEQDVGRDVQVVLVSFDPRDTPAKAERSREQLIRKYARPGSEAGWSLLTGEQGQISQLAERLGYHYEWDEATGQYAHPAGIFLVSPQGDVTRVLEGIEFSSEVLSESIAQAQVGEVSAAPVASDGDSFLRCYLYDPVSGKFGAAVQWTLRGLGLVTVAAIGWTIWSLSQRQRWGAGPIERDESASAGR